MSSLPFPTSYDANHPNEAIVPLPSTPLVTIATDASSGTLSYQAPLTHRSTGPGIILFDAPSPSDTNVKKANTLDPVPFFKWAEEGYAIALIGNDLKKKDNEDGIKKSFKQALELLDREEKCNVKEKYAVFGEWLFCHQLVRDLVYEAIIPAILTCYMFECLVYDSATLEAILPILPEFQSRICALITHGSTSVPESIITTIPSISVLSHVFKTASSSTIDMSDSLACPVPDNNFNPYAVKSLSHEYIHADENFNNENGLVEFAVLPNYGDKVHDHSIANLVHSRSLAFLKPRIGGPWFDLEKVGSF